MNLNLACGNDILYGYENYDKYPVNKRVKYIDLDILPLPFNDNIADKILLKQALEHLKVNHLDFMNEIYRILKPNGIIKIGLPVYSPFIYHITHNHPKGFFNPICEVSSVSESYCNGYFKLISVEYKFLKLKNFIYRIIDTIRKYIYQSVEFELKKVKK